MGDRGHMDPGYVPSTSECSRWETLLADALDGQLRQEDEAAFTYHMAICPGCMALFEEARRGREWLEFLSPEPEIPEGLLDRILAQTGPGQAAGHGLVREGSAVAVLPQPWLQPEFAGPEYAGRVRRHSEPRLLMTMAMAFFSIALTLNLVGFRFDEVRLSDLRPSAVRSLLTRRIVTASIPLLRYYDHLRFLYQVEISMRPATPSEGQSEPAPNPAAPISAVPDFTRKLVGFSPSLTVATSSGFEGYGLQPVYNRSKSTSALVPEGFALRPLRALPLSSVASTGQSTTRHAHSGSSTTRTSKRSSLWTA